MMWYLKIPAVLPETEVRLVDLLLAAILYAVFLALLARVVELTAIHFMIAYGIALAFLTLRIFGWNPRKSANRGLVLGHFFSGLWQFSLFTDAIGNWGIFRGEGTITTGVKPCSFVSQSVRWSVRAQLFWT